VLRLPPERKSPPPGGYTGWAGVDPSGADVQAWIDHGGDGNVALRLPVGVYGLDVDAWGGKGGADALAGLEARYGPLPATWTLTSRDDGVSGIRLFRADLPIGRVWLDEPGGHGAGIEAIHFGHRYAVAWPSLHPDTGRKYVWLGPDGMTAAEGWVPRCWDDPTQLEPNWTYGLSSVGEVRTGEMAGHEETVALVGGWRMGEACPVVGRALTRALELLREGSAGGPIHPVSVTGAWELVCLGHEDHAGVRAALARHHDAHVAARLARDRCSEASAAGEWWRAVRGAVGKLVGPARPMCDCALMIGAGVTFDREELGGASPEAERAINEAEAQEVEVVGWDFADALNARVLTATQVREIPPPVQLVEGLLCVDSESWLIGKSGSCKSFVALDIAGHVGAGRPWMGREVIRGDVFYLVAEGAGGMGLRVRAWEQLNGPMINVVFLPFPVQVKREDHWAALVEVCRRRQPALIILDTQARISVGYNENDNGEMGEVIEAISRLRRATKACALVVHHIGRAGQDARGASAIDGAQDSELRLTRASETRAVLETDKQRHLPDNVRVELELSTCKLDDGGTSLVVRAPLGAVLPAPDWRANLPLNQATLVEVMRDIFPANGATKPELKAEVRKRVRHKLDGTAMEPMGDSSFRLAWDRLVELGRFARVAPSQRYVFDDLTDIDQGVSG
jgi:hypothetical protein